MSEYEVSEKLVKMCEVLYKKVEAAAASHFGVSEWFTVEQA